jgi:truncated hemoglobin YjbI
MTLEPHSFMQTMVRRVDFTPQDQALLKNNVDWAKTIAPAMAEHFYAYLGKDEEMSAILNETEGRIHRLKATFVDWFCEMFAGIDDWGNAYAERRWKIGLIHVRVGIGPQHVVPAMAAVIEAVGRTLEENGLDANLRSAIAKIAMIDLTFIEQAYIEVSHYAIIKETGWTESLFKRLINNAVS